MKVGIYGGTFNPPHIGHKNAAEAAISELGLDRLIVIPVMTPPHKEISGGGADPGSRLEMCRLIMDDDPLITVSDLEIRRGGVSYTVDTVEALRRSLPDAELFLLMGTDMFECFEKWREFRHILEECALCPFSRHADDESVIDEKGKIYGDMYGAVIRPVRLTVNDISSTRVREMLPSRCGREYLGDQEYSYIIKKRLYGAKPEFGWLRSRAYSMLKPRRIEHVAGVEAEAVRLAERWGESEDDAREAAILHDITKKEQLDDQLKLCRKYGIIVDEMESGSEALLHSKTAAAVAEYEFGCSGRVADAIRWHTTGREDMTFLEKIIYLADFIEPTRSFEGIDEVRDLAYKDLNGAVSLSLKMSLENMRERGIDPHPRTVQALKSLTS